VPAAELIRKTGITDQTYYRWRVNYAGLEMDQVRQIKQLREENTKLKQLVAVLTLNRAMLQDVLRRRLNRPPFPTPPVLDRQACSRGEESSGPSGPPTALMD